MYTLLIADDEQLERQALRFIIDKRCPDIEIVGEAGDGKSAIHIAADAKPDIVLMDIRMPELNGLEAAKAIRAILPDVNIIMLTAFDEFSYAIQALTIGAVEYLLKPIRPDDIVNTLHMVMKKVRAIKAKLREEALLRKSVEKAIPFIQMSFVYDLISGAIQEMENLQERSRFLGLQVDPGVVMVVNIDGFKQLTCRDSEWEKQMIKQKMHQRICSAVGENALVTPLGDDNLIILLGFLSGNELDIQTEVRKKASNIRGLIAREMNMSITIGIGRYYADPREIHKSYLEALHAQRQRFYLGDSQVIHIEDVLYLSTSPFIYPFHYERAVLDKVRCGDRKQAKEALRQLLNKLFGGQASIETVKACVLELLIVLSRAAVEGGANLDQLTLLNFTCIDRLTACTSKAQVEEWMAESLEQLMDNMLDNRPSVNLRVINKACEYIVNNCHKNISLDEVAQTVHLSPFYFSRLFKQGKGYNFVDFITKVRIDKAKQLLQNPEFTAVRIAGEVGYQDASYFSRVFRQATGMTPNQYRQEIRNP